MKCTLFVYIGVLLDYSIYSFDFVSFQIVDQVPVCR